jgi:hypothetical protein
MAQTVDQARIFLPVAVLALLTIAVLLLVAVRRFAASFAKQVTAEDFRYGESERVPGHVALPNRAYMNLLEAPVLFYIAALIYYVTGRVDNHAVLMAWIYVALRLIQTLVHLTYNNVMHRLIVFAISNFVLAGLWVALASRLLASF